MTDEIVQSLDIRDRLTQRQVPALMMPRHSNFAPLEHNGHRFIVAEDGLWIEVRRPWLWLVWPVASSSMKLPYGEALADEMDIAFELDGAAFQQLLERFSVEAKEVLPAEHAAWFVWDEERETLEYQPLLTDSASAGGIKFHRPALPDHKHLAVDVHSHGAMAPFFSGTDDEDDAGEVKLSYVLGHVGSDEEEWRARLCAHGLFIPFDEEEEYSMVVDPDA